ncbi:propionate CoA-transferase [Xenorhabdus koppenhoeferi]|uniref:Acetate CoA-transferase YdiF n=2 Tax=Xenorhabdus koppenhoeferi TaxID=351659 RepID=A0A1I7ESJ4_9GAMM|nr:propionate CoA-transferase [Xenorhabdus koppenhoeferi]
MRRITAKAVAEMITNDSVVIPGGFGCCGHPDLLTQALSERFFRERQPTGLTLLFASGAGDKQGNGLDKLAHPALVKRAIGGFWGFCPALTKLGRKGEIEAHNWPMGAISHLFRDIASGLDGHFSRVGLHTFVDPRHEGGGLTKDTASLVEVVTVRNKELLYYPSPGADFALLRGTLADEHGNISMSGEAALHDAFWQAMATRNCGGRVAVQVENIVHSLPAEQVDIPGHLVDFIIETNDHHYPSYGAAQNITTEQMPVLSLEKTLIVNRACTEPIQPGAFLNFGIGIPALIGRRLTNRNDQIYTSVESGVINGRPKEGIAFGEVSDFSSIVQQSDLFSYYNGGGIDVAFLGFAEIDQYGNINASAFGEKFTGAGGFINIVSSAKKLVFCGTFTTKGLQLEMQGHNICIRSEGKIPKFVERVQQITVATNHSDFWDKDIRIITERAVFSLHKGEFVLEELTEGISINDVLQAIPFSIKISQKIRQ